MKFASGPIQHPGQPVLQRVSDTTGKLEISLLVSYLLRLRKQVFQNHLDFFAQDWSAHGTMC
jgi:hypothetical protein